MDKFGVGFFCSFFIIIYSEIAQADYVNPGSMETHTDPRKPQIDSNPKDSKSNTGEFLQSLGLTLGTEKIKAEKKPSSLPNYNIKHQLLLALGDDDVKEVTRLINVGVDKNSDLTGDGMTPLMLAQSPDMVKMLIQEKVAINHRDSKGATTLHHQLFSENSADIIPILLANGANVNTVASGMNNETPLLSARQLFFEGNDFSHAEYIVRLLLKAGADINAQDGDGYTLLITAAVNNKYELAQLMIKLGANVEMITNEGLTALAYAKLMKYNKIIRLLKKSGTH